MHISDKEASKRRFKGLVVLAIGFALFTYILFSLRALSIKECECEEACFDKGWPTGMYRSGNDTCYCKNELKIMKLYKGEQNGN